MKPRLVALSAAFVLAAGISACTTEEAYYGPPSGFADVDYDGYYDGYYGAFYGGYWGPDGSFYYWDKGHQHYHRDGGGHFRRQGGSGFTQIHGHAPAAGGRSGRHKTT